MRNDENGMICTILRRARIVLKNDVTILFNS